MMGALQVPARPWLQGARGCVPACRHGRAVQPAFRPCAGARAHGRRQVALDAPGSRRLGRAPAHARMAAGWLPWRHRPAGDSAVRRRTRPGRRVSAAAGHRMPARARDRPRPRSPGSTPALPFPPLPSIASRRQSPRASRPELSQSVPSALGVGHCGGTVFGVWRGARWDSCGGVRLKIFQHNQIAESLHSGTAVARRGAAHLQDLVNERGTGSPRGGGGRANPSPPRS